jgi:hypothetical protein
MDAGGTLEKTNCRRFFDKPQAFAGIGDTGEYVSRSIWPVGTRTDVHAWMIARRTEGVKFRNGKHDTIVPTRFII